MYHYIERVLVHQWTITRFTGITIACLVLSVSEGEKPVREKFVIKNDTSGLRRISMRNTSYLQRKCFFLNNSERKQNDIKELALSYVVASMSDKASFIY